MNVQRTSPNRPIDDDFDDVSQRTMKESSTPCFHRFFGGFVVLFVVVVFVVTTEPKDVPERATSVLRSAKSDFTLQLYGLDDDDDADTVQDIKTDSSATSQAEPVLPIEELDNAEDDDDNELQEFEDAEEMDSPPEEETFVPFEERKKFMKGPWDYEVSKLKEPKPTPSGWWPTRKWIGECANKPRELTPFKTYPDWVGYRLGDCIKFCGHGACPSDTVSPQLAHWSIAGEYYDRACGPTGPYLHKKKGNETLVDVILKKREGKTGFEKPDPDAVIIHLRLGDKIERSSTNAYWMLENSADPGTKNFKGMHGIKSLYELMTNIHASGAKKVVIRGGSLYPNQYVKSKTYAYCLQEAIEEAGYEVSMNIDEGNADADFFFLVHAKKGEFRLPCGKKKHLRSLSWQLVSHNFSCQLSLPLVDSHAISATLFCVVVVLCTVAYSMVTVLPWGVDGSFENYTSLKKKSADRCNVPQHPFSDIHIRI